MTLRQSTQNRSALLFLCMAAFILLFDSTIVRTLPSAEHDRVLGYAVLADFALVIPFLYWFLIARRAGKPVRKAVPLTAFGAVAAWLVLPASLKGQVWSVMWPVELLVLALEPALVGYELRMIYRFVVRLRSVRRTEPDTSEALRTAIREEFGDSKFAAFCLHDASLLYFLFFSWRSKAGQAAVADSYRTYSYHRQTSLLLYAGILTHIIVFEAVFLHLLVQQWSSWAAWLLTAADIWLLALIWADCRASALRPVRLDESAIRLRYGLRIQADVPLDAIAEVSAQPIFEPDAAERKTFALPLLGTPNVRIRFSRPLTVNGVLFLPREAEGLYLAMDDPQAFARDVRAAIGAEAV